MTLRSVEPSYHPRGINKSSFRSLFNIPHCCLLCFEVWALFNPTVIDHSLKPIKNYRLGKPLLHQLPKSLPTFLITIKSSISVL